MRAQAACNSTFICLAAPRFNQTSQPKVTCTALAAALGSAGVKFNITSCTLAGSTATLPSLPPAALASYPLVVACSNATSQAISWRLALSVFGALSPTVSAAFKASFVKSYGAAGSYIPNPSILALFPCPGNGSGGAGGNSSVLVPSGMVIGSWSIVYRSILPVISPPPPEKCGFGPCDQSSPPPPSAAVDPASAARFPIPV